MILRDYQKECVNRIVQKNSGSYLIQMATGLGKTATFTSIPSDGRVLILSHREELVHQPQKYYDFPIGIEQASNESHGEMVVSASVQTLVKRLDKFDSDEFDIIITDECHHAAAKTYRDIYRHFSPRLHLGFTATPNRGDRVRLNDIFSEIIFQRDLRWGIENGYLSNIHCLRANIEYDLSNVKTRAGDYAPGELDDAMNGTADAIAQAYKDHAKGSTLIFAVSVRHAEEIAERIRGAVVVTAKTKNRAEIIESFSKGEIPCLVNVMVFTEGTDIPRVETVIIARPTQSDSLYAQMVGRGLRPYPGKDKLILIDCVGVTDDARLCTAPTLIGMDMSSVPYSKKEEIQGDIFDLEKKIIKASDPQESWIKNVEIVDLWAKTQKYNLHGINWFKMPSGDLVCSLTHGKKVVIPCPDTLGEVKTMRGERIPMQQALDNAYQLLCEMHMDERYIWDLSRAKKWGKSPASDRQKALIARKMDGYDASGLTKLQASQILNRLLV